MPTITRQQAEALAALDWLFDETDRERRSGRSYILAVAYLRRAVRTGRWVDVEDHFDARDSDQYLFHIIRRLADDAGIGLELERRHRFRVSHAPQSAQRWLFEEFVEGEVPAIPSTEERSRERERRQWLTQGLIDTARIRPRGAPISSQPPAQEPEKPPPPTLWERLNGDDVV